MGPEAHFIRKVLVQEDLMRGLVGLKGGEKAREQNIKGMQQVGFEHKTSKLATQALTN